MGLYAMCPYLAGHWPSPECQSWIDNNGIMVNLNDNRGAIAYGHRGARATTPLPGPASRPRTTSAASSRSMISVNECDPLRDEGIDFYRLLLRAGVRARCRQVMGAVHGAETYPVLCPDISRDTAVSIADFARTAGR